MFELCEEMLRFFREMGNQFGEHFEAEVFLPWGYIFTTPFPKFFNARKGTQHRGASKNVDAFILKLSLWSNRIQN